MKSILFTNQKGGVGKTTLTREIGMYFADQNHKVLFVDCDPQANLTKSFYKQRAPEIGLFEALEGEEITITELSGSMSLLAGNIKLSLLEKRLLGELDAYVRLKELFTNPVFSEFDYVLIDTPPSLGILTVNALAASDGLVIPMSPSMYSMQGANDLISTVFKIRKSLNPELEVLGVVINCFDSVPVITRQIRDEIEEAFGKVVFQTALSKCIRIEEAIALRTSIRDLPGKHRVCDEITAISTELLKRTGVEV